MNPSGIGPVIDLGNPGRSRLSILGDMLKRGEITREQYDIENQIAVENARAFARPNEQSGNQEPHP